MKDKEFAPLRRRMQMVFQDPYASLDPRMKVRDIIAEPLETYHVCKTKAETTHRVLELMQAVGVPAEFLNRYPHQFRRPAPAHRHCPRHCAAAGPDRLR